MSERPDRRRKVLIVGARDSTFVELPGEQLDIYLLQSADGLTELQRNIAHDTVVADLAEGDECVATVQKALGHIEFDWVIALHEQRLELAARVGRALGARHISGETVSSTADKFRTRELNTETGLLNPRWVEVSSVEVLQRTLAEWGCAAVLKPATGAGSRNITFLSPESDVTPFASDLEREQYILEEFVEGDEYSIETFTFDSKTQLIAVTEKLIDPGSFVEIGHQTPARIPAELYQRLASGVAELMARVGHSFGPGHTEVKINARGIYLIETHCRYGGDRIWEMTGLTTGRYPQGDMLWSVAMNRSPEERMVPKLHTAAAVRFFTPSPGKVTSIRFVEAARGIPGVHTLELGVGPGDLVATVGSSRDRAGYVLATGPTVPEAITAAEAALEMVRIETDASA